MTAPLPVWFGAAHDGTSLAITPVYRYVGKPPHFILCNDGTFLARHNSVAALIAMAAEWQPVSEAQMGRNTA